MAGSQIPWIIEWLWVPLWLAVVELFRRVFRIDREHGERLALLEKAEETRDQQREEMLDLIKTHSNDLHTHNDNVVTAVSAVSEQVKGYGHRLGTIEELLMKRGEN